MEHRSKDNLTISDSVRCGQDEITDCPAFASIIKLYSTLACRRLLPDIPFVAAKGDANESPHLHIFGSSCRVVLGRHRTAPTRSNVVLQPENISDTGCTPERMSTSVKMGRNMG